MSILRERESNYELLRLVAMLGVVTLHAINANGGSKPFIVTYIYAVCHTAVPLFVLLSGYFGIKPKIEAFSVFVFQNIFFSVGISVIAVLLGKGNLQFVDFFFTWYWFTVAYIGLYIISPVLNMFAENISIKMFHIILCAFLLYEVFYGWFCSSSAGFNSGISLITLFGYYLLGKYIKYNKRYWEKWALWLDFIIVFCVLGICCVIYTCFENRIPERMVYWSYTNPMIIAASIFLFLCFSKIKFHNKVINYLAGSCYAVYLLHQHRFLIHTWFGGSIVNADGQFIKIVGIVVAFYIFAILLDQLRIFCWRILRLIWVNTNTFLS